MKCALCQERQGKRGCKLTSGKFVCPVCCAATRRDECEGCGYYRNSLAYQREKQVRTNFISRISPELDDQCDAALALVEKGQLDRGRAMLEDLQRQYPNYHSVLYGLGVCHGMADELDAAIACLQRAVEIYPVFVHAYYNLGLSYSRRFDLENAVKAYEAALGVDGSDGDIGRLARQRLDDLEAAANQSGTSLATHIRALKIFDRGFRALQEKRFPAAIDLFGQVLAIHKDHVQSYGNIGLAYALLGKREQALENLDMAISLDPHYEPALVNRAVFERLERLRKGETLPEIDTRELNYYSEFKLQGRSFLQEMLKEPTAGGK